MRPVLLLEVNEVPWRVIDEYCARAGHDGLRAFFERSEQFTSIAVDTGELSPWVTWPTLHRGMNNDSHEIRNLGQDPRTFKGEPVWETVRKMGHEIGVFGSMQSWPPIDPGAAGFYVPDTFAHDAQCIPPTLSPIQAFNLRMVKQNARVVSSSLPSPAELVALPLLLLKNGLQFKNAIGIALQLIREKLNPGLSRRRPIFQNVLFWDVFCKLYDPRRPPMLGTYFTNHVAGVMHRYWSDIFPADFPESKEPPDPENRALMDFAMLQTDSMLRLVMRWVELNPKLIVVFASSMGQAAVHRAEHEGIELVVENVPALLSAAGVKREAFNPLLAMVPQIAVEIDDPGLRSSAAARLRAAQCGDHRFIEVSEVGNSLSITVSTPPKASLQRGTFSLLGEEIQFSAAGIRVQDVEPGTAYHVPQGSLAVYHKDGAAPGNKQRNSIPADQIKKMLLDLIAIGPDSLARIRTS